MLEEDLAKLPGARRGPPAEQLRPMYATLGSEPFSSPDWIFEPKLDGIRLLARVTPESVRLFSRHGREVTFRYPGLVADLQSQSWREAWLDGELVAPGPDGRPEFERMQLRMNLERPADIARAERAIPVLYYPFDLLHLDGWELCGVPLELRLAVLDRAVRATSAVGVMARFADGISAFDAVRELKLEGLVAKRRSSLYEQGRRSPHWIKIKTVQSDDFVVVGFWPGEGSRGQSFGSLLLAQADDTGGLRYSGDVGTGFDDRRLASLRARLDELRCERPAIPDPPPASSAVRWVRPELVAEIKFTDRTSQGRLRAPVFLRLLNEEPGYRFETPVEASPAAIPAEAAPVQLPQRPPSDPLLEQLAALEENGTLQVESYGIGVTNLNKRLFPDVTKRQLIAYFIQVAPMLLRHLRDRPLTLTRFPNGVEQPYFYQKHWSVGELPPFVATAPTREGGEPWILCQNLPTLVWLAQLANLELHVWMSRALPLPGKEDPLDAPDFLLFDLDPYIYAGDEGAGEEPALNRAGFAKAVELALDLRAILNELKLQAWVKTSGKTGLHVVVPIRRHYGYEAVRAAGRTLGTFLLKRRPRDVTLEWTTGKRTGKIFVDVNQNSYGKSLGWAYSPRAVRWAGVSMPLRWDQLEHVYPSDFTISTVPAWTAEHGDPWETILSQPADLAELLGG